MRCCLMGFSLTLISLMGIVVNASDVDHASLEDAPAAAFRCSDNLQHAVVRQADYQEADVEPGRRSKTVSTLEYQESVSPRSTGFPLRTASLTMPALQRVTPQELRQRLPAAKRSEASAPDPHRRRVQDPAKPLDPILPASAQASDVQELRRLQAVMQVNRRLSPWSRFVQRMKRPWERLNHTPERRRTIRDRLIEGDPTLAEELKR